MKLLHVYTDGQPGDACPKKGGQPLRLGDGQCAGESRCRYYQGMGPFVTIKCAHPEAQCAHVEPQPVQESTTPGEPAGGPILSAWQTLKKQYPDVILLLRLGDFYGAFEEDARVMAQACDVVLTSRMLGKKRVVMAGVPAYAIERYVAGLIKAGHRVGICEQIRGDAEVMPTETLDEIYRRTAERQHAPDGIMTKIKAHWAGLNPPPSAEAPELAMPVEAPVSTSEPAPAESESAPTQLSLF